MMPIAALAPLLRKALELRSRILEGAGITRTVVAAFAAVCWALARLLLEAWRELTEIALVFDRTDRAS